VEPLTVVLGGLMLALLVGVLALGIFSPRSPREYLDWKPTRSPEAEAENEVDDVAQMIAAQNALRRRRGAPDLTAEEIERRVREDEEQRRRWRES
jgi:hypothetical protein